MRQSITEFLSFGFIVVLSSVGAAQSANDVPAGLARRVQATERDGYAIQSAGPIYRASNRGMNAVFGEAGIEVTPKSSFESFWHWAMELTAIGRGERSITVADADLLAMENRLEYRRGDIVEWYVNDARGIEQGFTIASEPLRREGRAPSLYLELRTSSNLVPTLMDDGQAIVFHTAWRRKTLTYDHLLVFDATGRELPACFELSAPDAIRIIVDDRGASYPLTVDPLITTEDVKLTASDADSGAHFGQSIAVSGDTALVGAPKESGLNTGAVYVFVRDHGGPDNWGEVKKLTASDAAVADEFGNAVAISGDTAVIGANGSNDAGSNSGAAYVFVRDHGGPDNWGEARKVTASDAAASDFFGFSVSISGDTAVIGAAFDDDAGASSGSAYVFARDQGGPDNWGEVRKLTASDAAAVDRFGYSVAISADTAVIGVESDDDSGSGAGSAYVFARNQGGPDNWGVVRKLTASDAAAFDHFGFSVSISDDTAVIGAAFEDDAAGSAYVFARDDGGPDNWGEVRKLTASDADLGDRFGWSVTLDGDTMVVGAFSDDDVAGNAGSAYVFVRDQGGTDNWGEVRKLIASDAESGDFFGGSVAISGSAAVVGAFGNDDVCVFCDSGSAYVFMLETPECFLVIGDGETQGVWSYLTDTHEFATQVGRIEEAYAVTLEQSPSFRVFPPTPQARPNGPVVPTPVRDQTLGLARRYSLAVAGQPTVHAMRTLNVQVLMWNPEVFPANPEQFSNGMKITVWSNGTVSATPYGAQDGMTLWLHVYRGTDGVDYYQFPFVIDW
jgi:hypothetical protein